MEIFTEAMLGAFQAIFRDPFSSCRASLITNEMPAQLPDLSQFLTTKAALLHPYLLLVFKARGEGATVGNMQ